MADLKKQLILEVSLGTQKLKTEIANLKKDLESVGKGSGGVGVDAKSLKKELKDVASSFREALKAATKDAIGELKTSKQTTKSYTQRDKEFTNIDSIYAKKSKSEEKDYNKKGEKLEKLFSKKATLEKNLDHKAKTVVDEQTKKEILAYETIQKRKEYLNSESFKKDQIRIKAKSIMEDKANRETEAKEARSALRKRLRDFKSEKSRTSDIASDDKNSFRSLLGKGGLAAAGLMAAGHAMQAVPTAFEDYKMLQASRRQEMTSNLLGGQYVSQYSRTAGRQFSAGHVPYTLGGAIKGGLSGAAIGAAAGGLLGGTAGLMLGGVSAAPGAILGAKVGGILGTGAGAISGGIDSYMGFSEKRAARFQKETQSLQDATNAAMQLNPARLGMIKRGASGTLLNINERQGAAMGFNPEEVTAQFSQLQGLLSTQGAAASMDTARRLNLNTGASISETGTMIQSLQGGNRQGFSTNAANTENAISKAFANGLDRSKTSKFLQETSSFLQTSTQFSPLNTGALTDRFTSMAESFGKGVIDETSMRQAQNAIQMQYQGSFAKGGIEGLGNISNVNKVFAGDNLSGIDFSTILGASANARPEDVFSMMTSQGKEISGVMEKITEVLKLKLQTLQAGKERLGSEGGPLGNLMLATEKGIPTEQAFSYGKGIQTKGLLPGVGITNPEIAGAEEQTIAIRNAKLGQAEVELGRTTFKTAIENTAKDLGLLKEAFSNAVVKFNEVMKEMSMSQVKYNPSYTGNSKGGK